MATLAAIGLGQLDAAIFHLVDSADMHAIGPDDVHMFLNIAAIAHE
jgi:hypothetical protein